jgi:hypothetical protein
MKNIKKHFVTLALLAVLILPALTAQAALTKQDMYGGATNYGDIQTRLGLDGSQDPRVMAAKIVSILLGFLGIVATAIILYAGFLWMTAGGDKEKVATAKKLMGNGVIGLIIILSAWALSSFIIDQALDVTRA